MSGEQTSEKRCLVRQDEFGRGLASLRLLDPTAHNRRKAVFNLSAEKDFINVAHMEHIDHPAKISSPTFPPREVGVSHQEVLYLDTGLGPHLFKLHPVKERLVHSIGNSTSKGRCVIIFFDLPDCYGVNGRWKSSIIPSLVVGDATFDWEAMKGLLGFYGGKPRNKVELHVVTGRQLDAKASGDKSGVSIVGTRLRDKLRDPARTKPALVLLQQTGATELNWSGYPFWWPVLAAPPSSEPCVFATKVAA